MPLSLTEDMFAIAARRGLSSHALEKLSGVDRRGISRAMKGGRGLSSESVDKLAAALGLRLAEGKVPAKPKGGAR